MVMGAGAVGGYFGGRISERTSANVTLLARGDHLKAIRKNGLHLKSIGGDAIISVEAFESPLNVQPPDLILFTVKSHHTRQAIQQIQPVVREKTQILALQNGIENYPKLVNAFGEGRVIQGFCKIGVGISNPGVIEHKAFGIITAGEKNGGISPRLKKLQKLYDKAEIPLHLTSEIERKVWLKFAWNCVFNMITALGNVTVEKLFENRQAEKLCCNIFEEIQKVAQAEGILITNEDKQQIIESARNLKEFTTSTYQDRKKGKKLEYEALTGALVRLAQKYKLNIPHNQTLYALLKLIDAPKK